MKLEYKTVPIKFDTGPGDLSETDQDCLCGGGSADIETKSVSRRRQLRFIELETKLRTAKMRGMTHKIWLTVGGSSVRRSHMTANRQRVLIDDPFIVGGQRLRVPCDPMASYRETANCRCDVEFVRETITGSSGDDVLSSKQNSISISQIAFGEFGAYARKNDGTIPNGLADAIVSAGAACRRGNPCGPKDGSNASNILDQESWRNIRRAIGGTDRTGGGDLMCVGEEPCLYVHSAYTYINGVKTLVQRDKPLTTSGQVTIHGSWTGDLTLHFYKLPFKGWLTARNLRGPT